MLVHRMPTKKGAHRYMGLSEPSVYVDLVGSVKCLARLKGSCSFQYCLEDCEYLP